MYVLALSDYKQHAAAAAGYKPAPQLGSLLYSPLNPAEAEDTDAEP